MREACKEIMAVAPKRRHDPQRIIGDLLDAEISEKKARSIKCRMIIAKLPQSRELGEFDFGAAAVDETLIWRLTSGDVFDRGALNAKPSLDMPDRWSGRPFRWYPEVP